MPFDLAAAILPFLVNLGRQQETAGRSKKERTGKHTTGEGNREGSGKQAEEAPRRGTAERRREDQQRRRQKDKNGEQRRQEGTERATAEQRPRKANRQAQARQHASKADKTVIGGIYICQEQDQYGTVCGREFSSVHALRRHICAPQLGHGRKVLGAVVVTNQCPFCSTVLASQSCAVNHASHLALTHRCSANKALFTKDLKQSAFPVACKLCREPFASLPEYNQHVHRCHFPYIQVRAAPSRSRRAPARGHAYFLRWPRQQQGEVGNSRGGTWGWSSRRKRA